MSINVVNRQLVVDNVILAKYLAVILALAFLLSWGGAFRSWVLSMPLRICFWLIIATLLLSQMAFIWQLISRYCTMNHIARFTTPVIAGMLTTILVSAEVNLLKMLPISPLDPAPFIWQTIYFFVPVMSVAIATTCLIGVPVVRKRAEAGQAVTPATFKTRDEQADLLDQEDDNNSIEWPETVPDWIHSQDHYLEICSQGQNSLLRARMKDAEDHYREVPAARVHRSWWVSANAVKKIQREGRNYHLITKQGEQIPVSRNRIQTARKLLDV